MKCPRKSWENEDRVWQGCGKAGLQQGNKSSVASHSGKGAEEYDRSLRRQECQGGLKSCCMSCYIVVVQNLFFLQNKRVVFLFFGFLSCGT